MINILIRTSGRHKEFTKCIQSIRSQTYKDIRLIISTDKKEIDYPFIGDVTEGFDRTIHFIEPNGNPYGWNLYCNTLKGHVKNGWFFYLDDDDYLVNKYALERIVPHLSEDHGTLCQFNRGTLSKPRLKTGEVHPSKIIKGKLGGSCIFLYHTHKNLADWQPRQAADYYFIKEVSEKLKLMFVPIPVVQAGNNGRHGR